MGKEKPIDKNSFALNPRPIKIPLPKVPMGKMKEIPIPKAKLPLVRVPRGQTVRWSIDYEKLFKNRRRK